LTLKDVGFEEKWGFEIWLNDLNPFLERFDLCLQCFDAVGWAAGRASGL